MCSVQADDILELERHHGGRPDQMCNKCGVEKGIVVLRVNDVYCKECFIPYFVHKFRSSIGKSKLLKSGDWILVAHSGGQASSALLHLIKDAMEDENKKKLKYTSVVLYVDEGAILEQSIEERLNICRQVIHLASIYGFPIYVTTLEMVYKVDDANPQDVIYTIANGESVDHLPTDFTLEQRLKDLFSSVTSLTAKEDLLLRLRHQLICKITEKLGLNKVFLGDSGTRLSVRLLADIAQGRGAQLTEDTGFSHNWGSQVLVMRPMREFVTKEIAVFNTVNKIKSICIPTLATKADHRASIVRLSEQFVHGLQMDFPSTISTVFRTGEKLCTNQQLGQEKCVFCQGILDVPNREDTAARATEFSHSLGKSLMAEVEKMVVVNKPQVELGDAESATYCCSRDEASNSECPCAIRKTTSKTESPRKLTREELIPHLCYGCRVVVRDMKDIDSLPERVHEEGLRRCQRAKMKQEISEYLLEDENS